jgi:hypothetical protein
MLCPKCQSENFEIRTPCSQCGFQGDASTIEELDHLQWLLKQMDEWETLEESAVHLKESYVSRLKDMQVALGLRLPSFTPEEAEKAWVELAHLETLFEKVEEWRRAGYFKKEMEGLDPVKVQRIHAEELRQRLEEYRRPELLLTEQARVKALGFLLDNIDLLASRQWFKSRKEIESAIAPILSAMIGMVSDNGIE